VQGKRSEHKRDILSFVSRAMKTEAHSGEQAVYHSDIFAIPLRPSMAKHKNIPAIALNVYPGE
jgi:hypothetical protein